MTDLSVMKEMLKRADIEYEEHVIESDGTANGQTALVVEAGYIGFCSEITFRPDGALWKIEAYE